MQRDIVLITDALSVDPDDVYTIIMLSALLKKFLFNMVGIIATHHFAEIRAKVIKEYMDEFKIDVPVYVGHGIPYNTTYNETLRNEFLNENEHFPTNVFGFPLGTCKEGERLLFPKFASAYQYMLGEDLISGKSKEIFPDGDIYLSNILKNYSKFKRNV